eukprot:c15479_g1_i1.p1 GENE.c15479_g1_i1~~c15479_g1_i1.p1  ORF type:complete len:635 (+),score=145.06 c15479_g1_i1:240-1907(+)
MKKISQIDDIPQLHINGVYYGDIGRLQEMEDGGELDQVLASHGVHVARKLDYVKVDSVPCTQTKQGILNIQASTRCVKLAWGDSGITLPSGHQWFLRMDKEPIFVGQATDFVETAAGSLTRQYDIQVVDARGRPVQLPGETSLILGEVTVGPPLHSGVLSAKATPSHILLSWKRATKAPESHFLLLMNKDVLCAGNETDHVVSRPNPGTFVFELFVTENLAAFPSEKSQLLSTLTVEIPKNMRRFHLDLLDRKRSISDMASKIDRRSFGSSSLDAEELVDDLDSSPSTPKLPDGGTNNANSITPRSASSSDGNQQQLQVATLMIQTLQGALDLEHQHKARVEVLLGISQTQFGSSADRNAVIVTQLEHLLASKARDEERLNQTLLKLERLEATNAGLESKHQDTLGQLTTVRATIDALARNLNIRISYPECQELPAAIATLRGQRAALQRKLELAEKSRPATASSDEQPAAAGRTRNRGGEDELRARADTSGLQLEKHRKSIVILEQRQLGAASEIERIVAQARGMKEAGSLGDVWGLIDQLGKIAGTLRTSSPS